MKSIFLIILLILTSSSGQAQTIEAENMSIKSLGRISEESWLFPSNGYIETVLNFTVAGSYDFEIVAKGSPVKNVWPSMELSIDSKMINRVTVPSPTLKSYFIRGYVGVGNHVLRLSFTNDAYQPPEDRNLYIDKVIIKGVPPLGNVGIGTTQPITCNYKMQKFTKIEEMQTWLNANYSKIIGPAVFYMEGDGKGGPAECVK